jgi:hypothetical protein
MIVADVSLSHIDTNIDVKIQYPRCWVHIYHLSHHMILHANKINDFMMMNDVSQYKDDKTSSCFMCERKHVFVDSYSFLSLTRFRDMYGICLMPERHVWHLFDARAHITLSYCLFCERWLFPWALTVF